MWLSHLDNIFIHFLHNLLRCLIAAGGDSLGTIDFYQMHSYEWEGNYSPQSPFLLNNAAYNIHGGKPNVIGEFSQDGGDGRDITALFEWAYTQGYSWVNHGLNIINAWNK